MTKTARETSAGEGGRSRGRARRALVSFGLVASLVTAVTFEASSQQKPPKAATKKAATKGAKGAPAGSASAPAASSAAPLSSSEASAPPTSTATTPMPTTTSVRKAAPPPPPPDDAKLRGLEQLAKDAAEYTKDAREFREAVTTIIKHHYEQRRRRVLSSLDREIKIESDDLKKARAEAIARLEEFVDRYSVEKGNAHPEHTPDAMFRLAALYEERIGEVPVEQQAAQYQLATRLYKKIIAQFPAYRERAAVFYYLGHVLENAGRINESQQVWRSLVCNNKYPYPVPVDPSNPDKDTLTKKPQDHSPGYWEKWNDQHRDPVGAVKPKDARDAKAAKRDPKKAKAGKLDAKKDLAALGKVTDKADGRSGPRATEEEPTDSNEETSYVNIYPDECVPIPQKTDPGQEPRYISEVWWRIGEYHFEQGDVQAGPYNFNRAVTAYRQSMKSVSDKAKRQVYAVSMYKIAWTYYKQQRYEQAVRQFVDLLKHIDEMEKVTGDPGADFRKEAADYIAGSVTFLDFVGPVEDEPFVVRRDPATDPDPVTGRTLSPSEQEKAMRVGLDRIQDERLVPQDRRWVIDIYRSLAKEYHELGQLGNETATLEAVLKKWPMHRDAPFVQDELARVYDRRAEMAQPGSPEAVAYASKALEARTGLADYVAKADGTTPPWVEANKNDPEAIQRAERLVKGGLRTAAAQHTINARNFLQQAGATSDGATQRDFYAKALDEYRLAEKGWSAYLGQDPNATDAYESRFWVADSRMNEVRIMVVLEQPVPPQKYVDARQAAAEVRDSNEDDRFLQVSASYVVLLADAALDEQHKLHASTNGASGFAKKDRVVFSGEGAALKVEDTPPPAPVLAAIVARDEYISRVPPQSDIKVAVDRVGDKVVEAQQSALFQYASAEYFYLYGQFDEAEKRLLEVKKDQCKKTRFGYDAQVKLMSIANLRAEQTQNYEKSKAVAEEAQNPATTCAMTEAQATTIKGISEKTIQTGAYVEAFAAFKKAQEMPDGPDRVKQWRTAGELYEVALKAAPDRQEAPEAALNGAFAYKQVGDYDKAIEMYRLFIDKYGDEKILTKLENGNPKEKKDYAERVQGLVQAYEALSSAYVLFFNYRAAAETSEKIASLARFPEEKRKLAAYNALVLYSNLGDREKMSAARGRFLTFKPSAEEKAEADYIIAASDLKLWDERGSSDANREARNRAISTMTKFHIENKKNPAAGRYNVNAAYWVAKMHEVANDGAADIWWKNTVESFIAYKGQKKEAFASAEATMAAEADFTMLDAKIRKEFDYETNHHRYKGTVDVVVKAYRADVKDGEKLQDKLDPIARPDPAKNTYGSIEYIITATARQGTLWDSLRTGLFNTREPALQLFKPEEEKLLKRLEESGNDEYLEKAALFRDNRMQLWRKNRDENLKVAEQNMVFKYTLAVALARKFNVRSAAVKKAMQRLAFYTDILGDAKMAEYTAPIEKDAELNFKYEEGMFQKTRPGMVVEPEMTPLPPPLPVVVAK